MKASYLITGATGFIGANLARELVRRKRHVSVLVRDRELNWRLREIASSIDIHECGLLDDKLSKVVDKIKPDYVFHLAAYGSLPQEFDRTVMVDINIKGTLNLIEAVKKVKCKLFVNTGSSSEYGLKEEAMEESDRLEPLNDYGVTKAAVTLFCQKIARTELLPIVTLRLFSPYGYFEEKHRLIPSVIANAIDGKPINVSSPSHVRDFVFIDDVVDAYMRACEAKITPGDIVNIGSGRQHSVRDVVNTVLRITNSGSDVHWGSVKKQERQVEPALWKANIAEAKRILRWEPHHTLEEGLAKTVAWFRLHKNFYV